MSYHHLQNCSSLLWRRQNQLSHVVSKFQSGTMSKQLGSGVRAEGLDGAGASYQSLQRLWSAKEGNQMLIHTRSLRFNYQREQVQTLCHTERRSQDGSCTLTESQTAAQWHDVKGTSLQGVVLKGIPTNIWEAHQPRGGSGCTAQLMGRADSIFPALLSIQEVF